jgi:hypothetical protein
MFKFTKNPELFKKLKLYEKNMCEELKCFSKLTKFGIGYIKDISYSKKLNRYIIGTLASNKEIKNINFINKLTKQFPYIKIVINNGTENWIEWDASNERDIGLVFKEDNPKKYPSCTFCSKATYLTSKKQLAQGGEGEEEEEEEEEKEDEQIPDPQNFILLRSTINGFTRNSIVRKCSVCRIRICHNCMPKQSCSEIKFCYMGNRFMCPGCLSLSPKCNLCNGLLKMKNSSECIDENCTNTFYFPKKRNKKCKFCKSNEPGVVCKKCKRNLCGFKCFKCKCIICKKHHMQCGKSHDWKLCCPDCFLELL